jgi:DNA-binding transcriptional MerR regulator
VTALTIDELARRTGMTARNVRAHQSRGLLPPPELRGRTGYYGPEHVARIELIRELQAEGFSLELIGKVLEGTGAAARFARALREPFGDEQPAEVTEAELTERWGSAEPALLARAEALGLLRPLGDGRWEERSPRLARAGEELARIGIPAAQALELAAQLREHADSVARAYVRLFTECVWSPFEAAGRPAGRWAEVSDAPCCC